MKTQSSAKAASPLLLAMGYATAAICLIIGLQVFLAGTLDIHLLNATVGISTAVFAFVFKLTGWTLAGFIPVGSAMAYQLHQGFKRGHLNEHHDRSLTITMALTQVIGVAGTIGAFIAVGQQFASTGTGNTQDTFLSVLIGFGSTLTALILIGIAYALQGFIPYKPTTAKNNE